jgi:predicted small integral membrane protein
MDVMAYLLEGDPAIRWQVMKDLTDAAPDEVAAERSRVATEGWGARLLAEQGPDGLWDGGTYRPGWADESRPFFDAWTATHFSLQSLTEYGLDPDSPGARSAIAPVRENARWEYNGELYFQGEAEPCINGIALAVGAYFGQDSAPIAETLLATQHADGGWNCWEEDPATPGSFHSTICVLEGLWAWEQATGGSDALRAARLRGEEYLLERKLFRRKSTGEVVDPRMTMLSSPVRWFYDVLRGLEYFRLARPERDPRCAEAVELVRGKRLPIGLFPLENTHMGPTLFSLEAEGEGFPSRWVTLRALRVLRWWDAG